MRYFLYGASGHGLVVADNIISGKLGKVFAFIDDDLDKRGFFGGAPLLSLAELTENIRRDPKVRVIITIGNNSVRLEKAQELIGLGLQLGIAIHPSAVVAPSVSVGKGTVIMAQAAVNAAVHLGTNVIVNTGATIDHECVIGDGAHISPGASLAGNVVVGARSHIGIGAAVIQGVSIGADAVIGAGSVVIRQVPPGTTVVGNPARPIVRRRN